MTAHTTNSTEITAAKSRSNAAYVFTPKANRYLSEFTDLDTSQELHRLKLAGDTSQIKAGHTGDNSSRIQVICRLEFPGRHLFLLLRSIWFALFCTRGQSSGTHWPPVLVCHLQKQTSPRSPGLRAKDNHFPFETSSCNWRIAVWAGPPPPKRSLRFYWKVI